MPIELDRRKVIWLIISITLLISFTLFSAKSALAIQPKNIDKLTNRVSKDYTKKFCNGIAFGLSKESALIFTIKENKETIKKN